MTTESDDDFRLTGSVDVDTIAREAHVDRAGVLRSIEKLVALGHLRVMGRDAAGMPCEFEAIFNGRAA